MKPFAILALSLIAIPAPAPAATLTGTWTGTASILTSAGEENTLAIYAEFRQEGEEWKGSLGPAPDQRFEMSGVALEGSALSFRAPMPTRVYEFELKMREDGDTLEGDLRSLDGKVTGTLRLTRD